MKLNKIEITNYGAIRSFNYSSDKQSLVLIGENGTGKSLILSNVIDALVELKRESYSHEIKEVKGTNFFKVETFNYINFGNSFSKCFVEFDTGDFYFDVTCPDKNIDKFTKEEQKMINQSFFEENGFSKKVNLINKKVFTKQCFLYFPSDRYYVPFWQNKENYSKFQSSLGENQLGFSKTNFIKNNLSEDVKEWLYRVFMESTARPFDAFKVSKYSKIQQSLNQILKTIIGENAFFGIPNRKNNNVPIFLNENKKLDDVSALSSGEMMMLSIFSSILKEYDLLNFKDDFESKEVCGICLIDEIDMNLHIKQQMEMLPELIKLFPNIQFIVSTHSPFFIKGINDYLMDSFDIVSLPSGEKINDIFDFSEIGEAIKSFGPQGEFVISKLKKLNEQIHSLRDDEIIVLTEGKTDAKYLKYAFDFFSFKPYKFNFFNLQTDVMHQIQGSGDLKAILKAQMKWGKGSPKIVAIFDNDSNDLRNFICSNSNALFKTFVDERVYAFCIPFPQSRNDMKNISIEYYFSDDTLFTSYNKKHLFFARDFNNEGFTEKNDYCEIIKTKKKYPDYILDGCEYSVKNNQGSIVSLSKNEFCDCIINREPGFENVDFANFKLIIDIFKQILCDMKLN